VRRQLLLIVFLLSCVAAGAQYRTIELLRAGQAALNNRNYVVTIQYCNKAIAAKAFMYEPWFMRAIAKYYLNDFEGASADCTEAIGLNPYIPMLYELRAACRANCKEYEQALSDIESAQRLSPDDKGMVFRHAECLLRMKELDRAEAETDSMLSRYPDMGEAYLLKVDVALQRQDTASASRWLDKALVKYPYEEQLWTIQGRIALMNGNWKKADMSLSKSIHLKPRIVNNYVYRAAARENLNKLREALEDYDLAIDLDPNNFLAHYNRGLLRLKLGDDNRAISDFDFVLRLEPDNLQALYNRARLLDITGDWQGAVRDYSRVIEKFPNFWAGLAARARCYRALGMTAKAELDEFRIFKAQMNKHVGVQPRWSKGKLRQVRKMSDVDVEKYDQLVIADEEEITTKYDSPYQGEVQKRKVSTSMQPMFQLSYIPYRNGVRELRTSSLFLDLWNRGRKKWQQLYVTCNPEPLDEARSRKMFEMTDSLSEVIGASRKVSDARDVLLERAVSYAVVQNYDAAVADLTTCLQIDSTSSLAWWQRAVCQAMTADNMQGSADDRALLQRAALDDIRHAIGIDADNAFLYYNKGNLHAAAKETDQALEAYGKAIAINPSFAEAYYNRAIVLIGAGRQQEAVKDLGKAGELGLYDAYSIMRQQRK